MQCHGALLLVPYCIPVRNFEDALMSLEQSGRVAVSESRKLALFTYDIYQFLLRYLSRRRGRGHITFGGVVP